MTLIVERLERDDRVPRCLGICRARSHGGRHFVPGTSPAAAARALARSFGPSGVPGEYIYRPFAFISPRRAPVLRGSKEDARMMRR